ncbi:hypothetical protein FRC12_006059 [Ceratobasidium sp. 428]|nr:hypothetical protein FRC12_006059 [Ceratobasidium sp. 428]
MDRSAKLAFYTQPCLSFAIFGSCKLGFCGQQELYSHKLPDDIRQTHFNGRLRAHILQALIIHSHSVEGDSSETQDYQWGSFCELYETLAPRFAPLGNVLCVDRAKIPELDRGLKVVSSWCQRHLYEFHPNGPVFENFVSLTLVLLELSRRVNRQSFDAYAPKLHSMRLVDPHPDLLVHIPGLSGPDRSIIHHFVDFYGGRSEDALKRAIIATHHVVFRPLTIEANVLIHLFESIGRDAIIQARSWKSGIIGIFNGLLLPQSWALDMVDHPPPAPQSGWSIGPFFESLYKTLEYMQTYNPNTSTLYAFHGSPHMLLRGVFILRICRLLILVAINLGFTPVTKEEMRVKIAHSLTGSGVVHKALCLSFVQAGSWSELVTALYRSPLNRGADRLVHMLHCSNSPPDPIPQVKHIIYQEIKPDLRDQLSLTSTPDQHQESNAGLAAEPAFQGQPKEDSSDSNQQPP